MNKTGHCAKSSITLDWLAHADEAQFIDALGGVFERAPWVAKAVIALRPFTSINALSEAMVAAMFAAPHERQRALIAAHPPLTGHARARRAMTVHSRREQQSAGLDACTDEELQALETLNERYRMRFGLPFIIAVKGLSPAQIINALRTRLDNTPQAEFQTSLEQIAMIARFRLDALIVGSIP
ncbi:MAG: 2-oxo-4-hydroxy-4-carboxy-5-ureidoimidazoline decarboxylase [Gammaproteobacteria bacterium]|nr:2-oxo-4-hydroxy-4-carboxy-5-ureidoimidazoline decarboxylase [Gammaproteobacteria bacterium]